MIKRFLIIIGIFVLIIVFIVLYLTFGFKRYKVVYTVIPPVTYTVYESKLTGFCYCKVYHSCSAIDCTLDYTYELHRSNYFSHWKFHRVLE